MLLSIILEKQIDKTWNHPSAYIAFIFPVITYKGSSRLSYLTGYWKSGHANPVFACSV